MVESSDSSKDGASCCSGYVFGYKSEKVFKELGYEDEDEHQTEMQEEHSGNEGAFTKVLEFCVSSEQSHRRQYIDHCG